MADLRIPPPNLPATTRAPADPARTQAARAASRAFFEAALGKVVETPAPTLAAAPAAAPQVLRAAPSARAAGEPQRLARPGSIVDIKV